MVAVAPGIQEGLVTVAEPPQATVTVELLSLAVTLNVPSPVFPLWQFRMILTPPEATAAAAAGGVLTRSAPAMTEISPSFVARLASFVPGRRLFRTHILIGQILRTLRFEWWALKGRPSARPFWLRGSAQAG
jgi:hypothetical protein